MNTDERMNGPLRDGLLALVALVGLLDVLCGRGRLDSLRSPVAALTGVVGAIGIEVVLLVNPERTRRLWGDPVVRFASLVGTVLGGRVLARRAGPWAAAALCWGLLAYLVLLVLVLLGRPNPVSGLVGEERTSLRLGFGGAAPRMPSVGESSDVRDGQS